MILKQRERERLNRKYHLEERHVETEDQDQKIHCTTRDANSSNRTTITVISIWNTHPLSPVQCWIAECTQTNCSVRFSFLITLKGGRGRDAPLIPSVYQYFVTDCLYIIRCKFHITKHGSQYWRTEKNSHQGGN